MAVHSVKPYWHDKDYKPPTTPKKRDMGNKRPLNKAEKEAKAKKETPFPWETK